MKVLLIIISLIGLALTIIPSILVFSQTIALATSKEIMIFGMLLWFLSAPFWLKEQKL